MIKLIVKNNVTFIQGKIDSIVYKQLKKELGYTPPDAFFRKQNRPGWDGIQSTLCWNKKSCKCAIKKDGVHFPSGLLSKTRTTLQKYAIPYSIQDARPEVYPSLNLSLASFVKIRDYQKQCIDAFNKRGRGVLCAATGAGKTLISAAMIVQKKVPTIFFVPSTSLLQQAKKQFEKFIIQNGKPAKIGAIGGGHYDIQDINIITIQTASMACGQKYAKYDDQQQKQDITYLMEKRQQILALMSRAQFIICDQTHHMSSKSGQTISDYCVSARYKIGVSATPHRDLADDILIDACFGSQFGKISASTLIKKGFLVKPKIKFIKMYQGMPTDEIQYQTIYKKGITQNTKRNQIIASLAITLAQQERNILILVKQIAHGQMLQAMIPGAMFLHGAHTSQQRQDRLSKIKQNDPSARITIGSVIFDQGIDCPSLDTLLICGGGKSATRALQRVGRVIRPYTNPITNVVKTQALVIDFQDQCKYLLQHAKKRRKMYSSQTEFDISDLEI